MIPKECKRLAEVDFPIVVVSRHSTREKSYKQTKPATLVLEPQSQVAVAGADATTGTVSGPLFETPAMSEEVIAKIFDHTKGHPYLVQFVFVSSKESSVCAIGVRTFWKKQADNPTPFECAENPS